MMPPEGAFFGIIGMRTFQGDTFPNVRRSIRFGAHYGNGSVNPYLSVMEFDDYCHVVLPYITILLGEAG